MRAENEPFKQKVGGHDAPSHLWQTFLCRNQYPEMPSSDKMISLIPSATTLQARCDPDLEYNYPGTNEAYIEVIYLIFFLSTHLS
jgi:hypothetical protein